MQMNGCAGRISLDWIGLYTVSQKNDTDVALAHYNFSAHQLILLIGPILWAHSGPLCHALSLSLWTSILHCHSPGVATVARRLRYSDSWRRLILVVVSTVASDTW